MMIGKTEARANFAAQHLAAAEYFVAQLQLIESRVPPSKEVMPPREYWHCWFAAVVFSAMALEANIYDVMTADERGEQSPLGARRFRRQDLRKPLLDRYALVHQLALNGATLPLGQGTAQAVGGLIELRDEIVHYKTEYRSDGKVSRNLEAILRSRIPACPYRCGDIFFPDQCVSVGGAEWAVSTSRRFILDFARMTGVRSTIQDVE